MLYVFALAVLVEGSFCMLEYGELLARPLMRGYVLFRHPKAADVFVNQEATERIPTMVSKARKRQQFRHKRSYQHHLHGNLGAMTALSMLTLAFMLGTLPVLDKNVVRDSAPEY